VPVVGADRAAPLLAGPAGGLVAHHLVDHPGGDAGVLEPGGEGVAEVVRAVQVHGVEQWVARRWQGRDWARNMLAAGSCTLERGGRQVELTAPRMLDISDGVTLVPAPMRPALRLLRITRVLRLSAT
jgi:hypothetical protein